MKNKVLKVMFLFVAALFCSVSGLSKFTANAAESQHVNTFKPTTNIAAPATVITRLTSGYKTSILVGSDYPSNLIIKVDNNLNALDASDNIIDSLQNVYNDIANIILPVIEIETEQAANALSGFIGTNSAYDLTVMSKNGLLVKQVRDLQPSVRGAWDVSGQDLQSIAAGLLANQTNTYKANIIIMQQAQASPKYVNALLGKFKGVWVFTESSSLADIYTTITSGAYGIICDDYAQVYNAYKEFDSKSIVRAFQNIGHRGLTTWAPENTMAAFKDAYDSGATHIELDAYICASGELVIMHDSTVNRTTNGTGSINTYTLTDLKNLKTKLDNGTEVDEKVPTLKEVFDEFIDKDIVIVLEVKESSITFIDSLIDLLDEYSQEERETIKEKLTIIAFDDKHLRQAATKLAEIPTAVLYNTYGDSSEPTLFGYLKLISQINTAPDTSKDNASSTMHAFISRGYPLYYWTQNTKNLTLGAVTNGHIGITTDFSSALSEHIKYIEPQSQYTQTFDGYLTATYNVTITNYKNDQKQVKAQIAKVVEVNQEEDYVLAVLKYMHRDSYTTNLFYYTRYTAPVKINLTDETETPTVPDENGNQNQNGSGKKGANIMFYIIPGAAILFGAGVFGVLKIKKNKKS